MSALLMVFLGGGAGAVMRHGTNLAALRLFGPELPLGTLTVNIVGSFLMGLFWAALAVNLDEALSLHARLLIATGFLGGFTTFSAYSLDVVFLWERGSYTGAIVYMVASVVLSVGALVAGLALGRGMATP